MLRDGSSVTVRPVAQDDEASLQTFLTDLCENSLRLRFFTGAANVADAAHWAACTPADRYGLLAHDRAGALVAHAVYVQLDQTRAEVAVEVADHLHGRGLVARSKTVAIPLRSVRKCHKHECVQLRDRGWRCLSMHARCRVRASRGGQKERSGRGWVRE